jgi:preprotein translocase subunit SecE
MGFNPFRHQRRSVGDYVLVVAAFVVIALLVLWAALG